MACFEESEEIGPLSEAGSLAKTQGSSRLSEAWVVNFTGAGQIFGAGNSNSSGKPPRYPITSTVAEGARQERSCCHAVQVVGGPPERRLKSPNISVEQLKTNSVGWDSFSFEQGFGPALLFNFMQSMVLLHGNGRPSGNLTSCRTR